jgi:hypothetical protein
MFGSPHSIIFARRKKHRATTTLGLFTNKHRIWTFHHCNFWRDHDIEKCFVFFMGYLTTKMIYEIWMCVWKLVVCQPFVALYTYIYNTENDEPVDLGAILRQSQLVLFPKKTEKDNPGCYTGWFMGNIWNIWWFIGKIWEIYGDLWTYYLTW